MQVIFFIRRYFLPQRFAAKTPLVVLFRAVLLPSGITLHDIHNAQVSNAKYRGQLGVAIGQEQVRVLPVGRTSNSPEAVHSHLKDQSQWSHQAHLFLPPLLGVGPSVQIRDGPLFFWRGDEKLSSAKFFNIYVCPNIVIFLQTIFSICFPCPLFLC